MKKMLLLFLLVSSVAYGQRWRYGVAAAYSTPWKIVSRTTTSFDESSIDVRRRLPAFGIAATYLLTREAYLSMELTGTRWSYAEHDSYTDSTYVPSPNTSSGYYHSASLGPHYNELSLNVNLGKKAFAVAGGLLCVEAGGNFLLLREVSRDHYYPENYVSSSYTTPSFRADVLASAGLRYEYGWGKRVANVLAFSAGLSYDLTPGSSEFSLVTSTTTSTVTHSTVLRPSFHLLRFGLTCLFGKPHVFSAQGNPNF